MTDGRPDPAWRFPNAATPPGSSVYYSLRFAPAACRDDLARLHGWRHEIHRVLDQVTDPGVASVKLNWWREELERSERDEARHPLSRALVPTRRRHGLPAGPFLEMIASAESRLELIDPPDFSALAALVEQDHGALFELIARCHGLADGSALSAARRLGSYRGLVAGLRDAGWLARHGHHGFPPADRLRAAGLTRQAFSRPEHRDALRRLLAETAEEVQTLRARLASEIATLPATLRIQARLSDRLLAELKASGFDVLDQRISLTPIRKLWHAWRESRR